MAERNVLNTGSEQVDGRDRIISVIDTENNVHAQPFHAEKQHTEKHGQEQTQDHVRKLQTQFSPFCCKTDVVHAGGAVVYGQEQHPYDDRKHIYRVDALREEDIPRDNVA